MFSYTIDKDLCLRLMELRHVDALYHLILKNKDHLREWVSWSDSITEINTVKKVIQHWLEQYALTKGLQAGMWYKDDLVGVIGMQHLNWQHKQVSIGYWIGACYEGHGIVTKSCRTLVNYAFYELDLHRVEIRCAEKNYKSRAIPERLGFEEEGLLKEAELLSKGYVDLIVYGMLEDNWNTETD